MQPLKVAVVTGRHPFDVVSFAQLWRDMPGVDAYIQHMEDFASDAGKVRASYDAVVFYNMHEETPTGHGPWYERRMLMALEELGHTSQGIVVLHHGLLAFPDWGLWTEVTGLPIRRIVNYYHDETICCQIADPSHPITRGLAPFEIVDETYLMPEAGPDNHLLITTDHSKSLPTLAWTRQFREARVFCYEGGHDAAAFTHATFRTLLTRGVQWVCGQL